MKSALLLKIIVLVAINLLAIYLYPRISDETLRIVQMLILILLGSLFSLGLFSIFNGPTQFFIALKERIVRPLVIVYIAIVRIFGMLYSIGLRFTRLIIALVLSAVYGVSPIDFIPDIFLGIGQLDDVIVILSLIFWGIAGIRREASSSLRQYIQQLNNTTRIRTNFP